MYSILYHVITICLICATKYSYGIAPKGHPKVTKTKSVEKVLIRTLLNRYEEIGVIGRPVNDSKIQMTVSYGLQLFQILDLDENKQILRTNCWSTYKWQDSLLTWDPKEFGDITSVRIDPSQIWTPDIKLYNFADERLVEQRMARVVVEHDGSTLWVPQALFKSTCEVEITFFPFDTQICMLEFGSWTYDRRQMDIVWWQSEDTNTPVPYLDFSDYVKSNEWRTDGEDERSVHPTNRTKQIRSVKKYRRRVQTVGNETVIREYPVLRYLVRMRRNPNFYFFMLVIPSVLLSSLTLVVFWLPPESPAKMMLGMNIFVAFFILLLLLAESTPSAVKKFPLIGVYFCLNMIMITLSTFLATLVIHLYFRGDRNGTVPKILRRVVIEGIGNLLLARSKPKTNPPSKKNTALKNILKSRNGRTPQKYDLVGNKQFPSETSYREEMGNVFGPTGYQYNFGRNDARAQGGRRFHESGSSPMSHGTKHRAAHVQHAADCPFETGDVSADAISSTVTMERNVREVKRYVKMFVNRQKEARRKNLVAKEWRTLAIVLDRLFFFLYIATIGIAVIVSVPKTTDTELSDEFRSEE